MTDRAAAGFALLARILVVAAVFALLTLIAAPRSAPDPTVDPSPVERPTGGVADPSLAVLDASGLVLSGVPRSPGPSPLRAGATAGTGGTPPAAISSGRASYYHAAGDVAAVPWWEAGQDPVWAVVDHFRGGRTYSVTVLIVGKCGCYVGTPNERAIDLSDDAFVQLAPLSRGVITVTIEIGAPAPALPRTDSR